MANYNWWVYGSSYMIGSDGTHEIPTWLLRDPKSVEEWKCPYCSRVNPVSNFVCDGCGGSKEIE